MDVCGLYLSILYITISLSGGAIIPDSSWDTIDLWPGGVIPYYLSNNMYSPSQKGLILSAMRRWESKTCVKFVPWTDELMTANGERHYVNFFSAGSCFSKNGKFKHQPQLIGISKGCLNMWTVLHELGHTIGRIHEMERTDRDYYIEINADNMNPASSKNFQTVDQKKVIYNTYNVPYDYKSVMHYGPKAWSANDKPVMATKDPAYQTVIGKGKDISFFDALYANRAYNCSAKCSRSLSGLCRNGGFLGGPDCRCFCQDGYTGQFCDQTLPGFKHIVEWRCQSGWDFQAGKCYLFGRDDKKSFQQAKSFCVNKEATLVTFKTRPTMEWLSQMVEEKKSIQLKKSYWVGITRERNTTALNWIDGTFVDYNHMSLVENVLKTNMSCAKFDGETVLLDACNAEEGNGFVCVKDFDPDCGGRFTVRDKPITIQTPNFPKNYPDSIQCTYIFQTNKLSTISLSFESFSLEMNCNNDYTEVKLTNDVTKHGIRYCGPDLNQETFTSDGNTAVVIFKSNHRVTSTGFKATATMIPGQGKGTQLSFLETIQTYFQMSKEKLEERRENAFRKLKVIYDLVTSMAFAKVM